ncbi:DUF6942 family protein [Planctobacterium marinum]|uniref:Uncharacterized protein n=1 Tax=Planctobacterium marinum TaxID=1631968 RepID=A0AA48HHJ8_9ALTE|nr:hypothetical protein MACH26_25640 [Planctobacterium marinum]
MEQALPVGLGDIDASFRVYMGNIPNYRDIPQIHGIRALQDGEVKLIGDACGNGWRKVFNVYAKLVFALKLELHNELQGYGSWQQWRDECLLRADSNSVLLFSKPESGTIKAHQIHIVMGKAWAKSCGLEGKVEWLNKDFAIHPELPLIVCPYFDYRQLSNQKILFLSELIAKYSTL